MFGESFSFFVDTYSHIGTRDEEEPESIPRTRQRDGAEEQADEHHVGKQSSEVHDL